MISVQEFCVRARLEHRWVEAWVTAGWLVPPQADPELMLSDLDLARARLIRDLREEDIRVNDEGMDVDSAPARPGARAAREHAGGCSSECDDIR